MICVLFTDIVNYTELAKKYNDKIIFKLLHNVYNTFDNSIKKYTHLQKIETIQRSPKLWAFRLSKSTKTSEPFRGWILSRVANLDQTPLSM